MSSDTVDFVTIAACAAEINVYHQYQFSQFETTAVAGPGFLRGGARQPSRRTPKYDFAKISQKLHEIKRIWTPGGVPRAPLRPATAQIHRYKKVISAFQCCFPQQLE